MDPSIVYDVPAGPIWDWRVAFDFYCGGIGVGAFLFGVVLDEIFPTRFRSLVKTAAWMAPVFVALGLVVLMAKMGRPFLSWLPLVSVAPSAPLWWGGWLQLLLVIGSVYYAVLLGRGDPAQKVRRIVGRITGVIAVLVGTYHGALLALMPARPLWSTGPTILVSIFAFMTTGIAAVILVWILVHRHEGQREELLRDLRPVRWFLGLFLALQVTASFIWWLRLSYGSLQDAQALAAANAAYGPMFWGLGIVLGLLLPIGLGAWMIHQERGGGTRASAGLIALSSALILIGAFFFRLGVILGGQMASSVPTLS